MADRPLTDITGLLGPVARVERHSLENGLEVRLVPGGQAPIVVISIWYRVGTRDETPEQGGIAHFLEHMMFKGSAKYPMGAIDRLTQSLGGENNAFTTHDVTAYYFGFSARHWTAALDVEADRMESLTLDKAEFETERQVILEEIAMYEDDPWESLEMKSAKCYYGRFPYGRSILGTRDSVAGFTIADLEAFYRRHYRVDNSVLVVAGDIPENALAEIEARFASMSPGGRERMSWPPSYSAPTELGRLRHPKGATPRMLLSLPAPAATDSRYAAWRLLMAVLGNGRSSRLYRKLVDEERLCSSASAELTEMAGPGMTMIATELLPDAEPAAVEEATLAELVELGKRPPTDSELERARRLLLSDWVFGLERIQHQAMLVGQAEAVLGRSYLESHLRGLVRCGRQDLSAVGEELLPTAASEPGGVLGWVLAEAG
ncbi:MAG: M16 family metallopeptidase [Thermoanaerobaculia bacterium]